MPLHPQVRAARDFLLLHREDYQTAYRGFAWPDPPIYNFATDWFDGLADERGDQTALWVIDPPSAGGPPETSGRELSLTFAELRDRSIAVARWFMIMVFVGATGCWSCSATASPSGR